MDELFFLSYSSSSSNNTTLFFALPLRDCRLLSVLYYDYYTMTSRSSKEGTVVLHLASSSGGLFLWRRQFFFSPPLVWLARQYGLFFLVLCVF
jgi:hypothetical protein